MSTLPNINLNGPASIGIDLEAMKKTASANVSVAETSVQTEEIALNPVPQPDANGEFKSPVDGAVWMARLHGKRQTPLRGKAAFISEWEKNASADPEQIRKWAAEHPGCNFGSVADDGLIFETDSPEVRQRFTGQFTQTLTIQSSEQKGHRYYLPASIEHIAQHATQHGDFSLRKHNAYCVSPGSIHPQTGKQYRVAINVPIIAPTTSEIAFWNSERAERKSAQATQKAQIPSGQRNSMLASIAGKLIDAGMSPERVKEEIIEINEERCSPPLSQEELKKTIFHSVDTWSLKEDAITRQVSKQMVILGGKVMGLPTEIDAPSDPASWRDSFKSVGELEEGDLQMLIDGFLPEGTIFLGGLPGEGKTLFALSIAKALTTGNLFLGKFYVPKIVPVIYLIPESGGRAFRRRCEKFNIPNDPELFLCRTVSEGATLPLDNASLFEAVRKLKPVVILDTIIRFSEAEDENQATQNKKLVDDIIRLRQAGAVAVIGLHHATKTMRDKGMSLETALRGTGDIAACADAVYGLLRDSRSYNGGLGPNEIEVECLKPRDFEPPLPFRIAATQKSAQGLIQFESVIDLHNDFILVNKSASQQVSGDTLERLVTECPTISIKDLAKATGLSDWKVRMALEARQWFKHRGGTKSGSRWAKIPANGSQTQSVNPPSKVRPIADVNFESGVSNQTVN